MNRRRWASLTMIAAASLLLLIVVVVPWALTAPAAPASPPDTTTTADPTTTSAPLRCDTADARQERLLQVAQEEWGRDNVVLERDFVLDDPAFDGWRQSGNGAFTREPFVRKADLTAWQNGGTAAAEAARDLLIQNLEGVNEMNFKPTRLEGIQVLVPYTQVGNSLLAGVDGRNLDVTVSRGAGEILWVYVEADCTVHLYSALRAACGNPIPGSKPPVPPPPPPEPPPGSTTTTTVPGSSTTTTVPDGKDACESPVEQEECGDPGNDDPRDDPVGTQPPRPPTTTTTAGPDDPTDSGPGATNTSVPPTTEAPPPAPPDTGSPDDTAPPP